MLNTFSLAFVPVHFPSSAANPSRSERIVCSLVMFLSRFNNSPPSLAFRTNYVDQGKTYIFIAPILTYLHRRVIKCTSHLPHCLQATATLGCAFSAKTRCCLPTSSTFSQSLLVWRSNQLLLSRIQFLGEMTTQRRKPAILLIF